MKQALAITRLLPCFFLATALSAQTLTPTVTSFTPNTVSAGSVSFTLSVNGSSFLVGSVFLVWTPPGATTPLAAIAANAGATTTNVQFTVPVTAVASSGTANFVVRNVATTNFDSANQTFAVTPAPSITSINPVSRSAGGPAFNLTVTGSNFLQINPIGCTTSCIPLPPAIVFGGIDIATTFVSATQVTTAVPIPTGLVAPGLVSVTVRNPDGSVSNAAQFTILPQPVITSFSPSYRTVGSTGFNLTVNGANFTNPMQVFWNGNVLLPTTFINSTQLSATVSTALVATPAFISINAVTSDGASSNFLTFPVYNPPNLTALSTFSVTAGAAAFSLDVGGSFFRTGDRVRFGGTPVPTTLSNMQCVIALPSENQICGFTVATASISAAMVATPQTIAIDVLTADNVLSQNSITFFVNPAPVITAISPTFARIGSPGFNLRVFGANIDDSMTVQWNGTDLLTDAVSLTELDATVPANLLTVAGNFNITVKTFDGVSSAPAVFTVLGLPTITSLIPNFAVAGNPGFTLTVNGANYDSGSKVLWNESSLSTTFVNASQLSAQVSAALIASAGTADIMVFTGDGASTPSRRFPIYQRLQITTASLLNPFSGVNLNIQLTATGGLQPYSWSVSGLPPGISVDSSTGIISGAAQVSGSFNVIVTVRDASQQTATAAFPMQVQQLIAALEVATASLPPGVVGQVYGAGISARGGTPGYSFTLASGSLPGGLSLSGDGAISGTPTAAGQFPFSVRVADSAGRTATGSFILVIAPPPLTVTGSVSDVQVGSAISVQFGATGGVPPYTFAVSGSVPSGTSFSNGTLSGTATAQGTFQFTVAATDSQRTVATKTFTIAVSASSLTLTGKPGNGQVDVAYSAQFGATGGTPPYTFSASGLPPGVQLSGSSLTGTPATAGTFSVTVTVTDSPGAKASGTFTVEIAPAGLRITTSSLPDGTIGAAYSATLGAAGGTQPYTFSAAGLPPGVTASSNGALTGTPTQAGTFNVTATVTDSVRATANRSFMLTIASPPLSITTVTLPTPTVGTPFNGSLSVTGGVPPFTWTGSGLPAGVNLSPTGAFSGSPSAPGTSTITVTVTDSTGATATRSFSVTVALPTAPAVNVTGLPANLNPGSQQSLQIGLESPYPTDVNVTATLTFAADSGPDDPAVQFAAGGRSMQLTIPAGSTAPSTNIGLQTGTVAGTITITFHLTAATSDITPTPVPVRTVRLNPSAPVISTVTAVRNATGFTVTITGFSSTRDMTQAVFQFNPAAGSTLQTTQLTVSVGSLFSQYYTSTAAAPFGSQFVLTQPFTVQGSTQSIQSVGVTLANRMGNSNTITANLQ